MTYDIDYRYRLALQPDALTTLKTTLAAIDAASADARNAGLDPETDPAIILLARRVGRIASRAPLSADLEDAALRLACQTRIDALTDKPAFVVLARRGIGHDPAARDQFIREATAQLRKLTSAFDPEAHPTVRTTTDFADRVEIVAETDTLFVRVTTDLPRPGCEIDYRRNDRAQARSRTADIAALLDPDRFARDIRRTLDMAVTPAFA